MSQAAVRNNWSHAFAGRQPQTGACSACVMRYATSPLQLASELPWNFRCLHCSCSASFSLFKMLSASCSGCKTPGFYQSAASNALLSVSGLMLTPTMTAMRPLQDAVSQAEAERRKRAQILESEGARQSKINVAEGEKAQVILSSEAAKQDAINRATGACHPAVHLHCK